MGMEGLAGGRLSVGIAPRIDHSRRAIQQQAMAETYSKKRWSAEVTANSDTLDLEPKVFEKEIADEIAHPLNLKRSAAASERSSE
jgi:hypothetical protein